MLAYAKALVPLAVAGILAIAKSFGIGSEMKLEDILTLVFTSGIVYLVPNKK